MSAAEVWDGEVLADDREVTALPAVQQPAPLTSFRASLAMSVEEAADQFVAMDEFKRKVMRNGVDYGKIPGVPKPSLWKPGAERVLMLFGFGHHFDEPTVYTDADGKLWGFTYRCIVTRPLADGRDYVVSMCDGHASRDESKWKAAPANTLMKMAQKRALVGAALTATGSSDFFTQDVEDFHDEQDVDEAARVLAVKSVEALLRAEAKPHAAAVKDAWEAAGLPRMARSMTVADLALAAFLAGRVAAAPASAAPVAGEAGREAGAHGEPGEASPEGAPGEPVDGLTVSDVPRPTDVPSLTELVDGPPPPTTDWQALGYTSAKDQAAAVKSLNIVLTGLGRKTPGERYGACEAVVGHPIGSTKQLAKHEVQAVLKALGGEA